MGMKPVNQARAAGLLIATLCAFAGTSYAFDTGPHFDITEDVLRSEGFSSAAIATVQTANFFVDFYEFMGKGPKKMLDKDCTARVDSILIIGDAQHFDDLDSTQAVAQKWDAMLDATMSTAASKTKNGDVLGLLALLGMSLHNVQDFYAHSNWVDGGVWGPALGHGPLAKYGDHPTWLSVDRADREALDIYTRGTRFGTRRTHGDWDTDATKMALNKDWAGRPHYSDAYICAYFASRQWVRLFRTFVNDAGTWTKMQQWSTKSFDPARDWDYARKISFYGGHWYGNGGPTGFLDAFSSRTAGTSPDLLFPAVLRYIGGRCITKNRSVLRSMAESLLGTWGKMPYHGPVNPTLPSAAPDSVQFVQLQVHRIDATDADDGPGGGEMDWFSRVQLGGQRYMSGLIDEHDHFDFDKFPYGPWTMTKALPPGINSVLVIFELYDLDYKNDDLIDINPRSKAESLVFNYLPAINQVRGEVTGNPRFTTEGHGDCDCARVNMGVGRLVGTCSK